MDIRTDGRFQAGDILVASDNELDFLSGYLGHSALAVNDRYMIESVAHYPYIQMVPISRFFASHQRVAVYRPRNPAIGRAAAGFALWYYQVSVHFRMQGKVIPPFSFSPNIPLWDPWTSVYCSKLIWLSYYYGAGLTMNNDFFLFSPEDIDTLLQRDPRFILLYRHPEFGFLVNT